MACWNIVQGYTPNYMKLTPTHLLWYTCITDIMVLPRKINHLSGDINWFVEIVVRLVLHVITALLAAYLLAWPPFRVHCAQRICTLSSHFFFFFFWSSKMSAKKNILLPPDQWYACVCVCVHVCMIMYICVCRMTLSPLCFTCNFHEVLICTPEYKILITQFNICCECACMCVCIFVCKWVCVCSVWITPFL